MFRYVLIGIVALVLFPLGIGFWAQGTDFILYRTFAPAREEVRREVFEQSQSRVQGQISALNRYRVDYAGATSDAHRCAIRALVLSEAANTDMSTLPTDLSAWVTSLREVPCVSQ